MTYNPIAGNAKDGLAILCCNVTAL